ncbi:MAG: class I SAM-dependent methyltransferase [Candidatus Deferrimicrobiaceae bacterium]
MNTYSEHKGSLFRNYRFTGYTHRFYGNRLRFLHSLRMETVLRILHAFPEVVHRSNVVEIGCLDLFSLCLFCEAGYLPRTYAGVDIFWEDAEPYARENAARIRDRHRVEVNLVRDRAETFSSPAKFDTVVMLETLEHVDDEGGAIRNAASLLREGGHLLLSVPVEFGLLFGIRELARWATSGKTSYSVKEFLLGLRGKTRDIPRETGDHKGYDYRRTVETLKDQGFVCRREILYPLPISGLSYGYVGLYTLLRPATL